MLKAWLLNPKLGDLEVEDRYISWVESLRTDRYVTALASDRAQLGLVVDVR